MKTQPVKLKNSLILLLTAAIWGVAFVAQSVGMDYVGGFTFNMVRCIIGAIVLLPVIWFLDKGKKPVYRTPEEKTAGRTEAVHQRKTGQRKR